VAHRPICTLHRATPVADVGDEWACQLHEDEERKRRREHRERVLREVRYFESLAVEAEREGKPERATYYRACGGGHGGTARAIKKPRRSVRSRIDLFTIAH
jgi:hypothetical protein